jgi:general stress protein CsbA
MDLGRILLTLTVDAGISLTKFRILAIPALVVILMYAIRYRRYLISKAIIAVCIVGVAAGLLSIMAASDLRVLS